MLHHYDEFASLIDAFFTFARAEQQREAQELIGTESLNEEAAKRYIATSLKESLPATMEPIMHPFTPIPAGHGENG